MACVDLPIPTIPALGFGLNLGVAIPTFSGDLALCCKIISFTVPPIPIPIPAFSTPGALTAAVATINAAIVALNAYHDALSFDCPLEGPVIPA